MTCINHLSSHYQRFSYSSCSSRLRVIVGVGTTMLQRSSTIFKNVAIATQISPCPALHAYSNETIIFQRSSTSSTSSGARLKSVGRSFCLESTFGNARGACHYLRFGENQQLVNLMVQKSSQIRTRWIQHALSDHSAVVLCRLCLLAPSHSIHWLFPPDCPSW